MNLKYSIKKNTFHLSKTIHFMYKYSEIFMTKERVFRDILALKFTFHGILTTMAIRMWKNFVLAQNWTHVQGLTQHNQTFVIFGTTFAISALQWHWDRSNYLYWYGITITLLFSMYYVLCIIQVWNIWLWICMKILLPMLVIIFFLCIMIVIVKNVIESQGLK